LAAAIRAVTEPWSGGLLHFSGPVLEEEIAWAERELGVVFPRSYRTFLRYFGSGKGHYCTILGIRSEGLWQDVVAANHLAIPKPPDHLIRIAETIDDHTFYLDMSQPDARGECPVVVFGPGAQGRIFAASFLHFLSKVCQGLQSSPRLELTTSGS